MYVQCNGVLNLDCVSNRLQILLFLIASPVYILMLASRVGSDTMQLPDIVFSRVLMGLILIEFFADQQQWSMNLP